MSQPAGRRLCQARQVVVCCPNVGWWPAASRHDGVADGAGSASTLASLHCAAVGGRFRRRSSRMAWQGGTCYQWGSVLLSRLVDAGLAANHHATEYSAYTTS